MHLSADHKRGPRGLGRRFFVEAALASASAFLLVLTAFWHDWVELLFRVGPDHGNGGLERVIVAFLAICTVVLSALASVEWRSTARRPALDAG